MSESKVLPFHEVANLFPLLEGPEFDALKADIAANGLREPIWTWQGSIIDGRNRYRACLNLGVKPAMREWNGHGSLVAFVISVNLRRRHLDSAQRAALAVELLPMLQTEAKERQRQAGREHGRGRAKLPQKTAEAKRSDGEARKQAAKMAGTNGYYVSTANKLKETAPDLFEKVKAGKMKIAKPSMKPCSAGATYDPACSLAGISWTSCWT